MFVYIVFCFWLIMDCWLEVFVVFVIIFNLSSGEEEKVMIKVEYKLLEEKC